MRSLRGRLKKLEEAARLPAGHCPHCPPARIAIVEVDQDGNLLSGAYPPRCAHCGGPHGEGMSFIEVVVPRDEEAADTGSGNRLVEATRGE